MPREVFPGRFNTINNVGYHIIGVDRQQSQLVYEEALAILERLKACCVLDCPDVYNIPDYEVKDKLEF